MRIHSMILILVMALVTFSLRALPFLIFTGGRKTPAYVEYLGRVLPEAVIAMLVVYCLKDVSLLSGSHGIPEALSLALVVFLQSRRHNTILSILAGTAAYMLLIQNAF